MSTSSVGCSLPEPYCVETEEVFDDVTVNITTRKASETSRDILSTTLRFSYSGKDYEAEIQGKFRSEEIRLKVGGVLKDTLKISSPSTPKIEDMYLLEALTRSKFEKSKNHVSVGVVRAYDKGNPKCAEARQHLKAVFEGALEDGPFPKRVTARLITNEHHWQLVILDIDAEKKPTLTIVNSTNEVRSNTLSGIKERYLDYLKGPLDAALSKMGCSEISDLNYMQGLQFGNMGCGIAADLNDGRLYRGELDEESVWKESDVEVTQKIVRTTVEIDGVEEVLEIPEKVLKVTKDRSVRDTVSQEAFKRIILHLELEKRRLLKEELSSRAGGK